MSILIHKANRDDCKLIHRMQISSFRTLLGKYQDYDMSPGNETIQQIYRRFDQPFTDYHLIKNDDKVVGAIRIIRNEKEGICRVSPVFILPQYQGQGIAQQVFYLIEKYYDWANKWKLDTILQEQGNCYLYEKMGYKKTGKEEKVNDKMTIVYYEKDIEN
ncbi:MAG: GNAT family N-acetyltransferase [Firmicutes bacterium]|nr:GNAT family N-acetyltransferase [Bacillota bacterium]